MSLVALLGTLGRSVQVMQDIGRKHAVVDGMRQNYETKKTQLAMQARMDDEIYPNKGGKGGRWDD